MATHPIGRLAAAHQPLDDLPFLHSIEGLPSRIALAAVQFPDRSAGELHRDALFFEDREVGNLNQPLDKGLFVLPCVVWVLLVCVLGCVRGCVSVTCVLEIMLSDDVSPCAKMSAWVRAVFVMCGNGPNQSPCCQKNRNEPLVVRRS